MSTRYLGMTVEMIDFSFKGYYGENALVESISRLNFVLNRNSQLRKLVVFKNWSEKNLTRVTPYYVFRPKPSILTYAGHKRAKYLGQFSKFSDPADATRELLEPDFYPKIF